jgi:hypothetical protein
MRRSRFDDPGPPLSLAHAMARFIGDVRRGARRRASPLPAEIPDDPASAPPPEGRGYYFDASMVGTCALPAAALLAEPIRNPIVAAHRRELERSQPKSFAAGMDMILADVLDSARARPARSTAPHARAGDPGRVPARPRPGEPGTDWIAGTQAQRAAVLAAQTAVLLASYLRMLGHEARSHTATCSDVDLNRLAVAAGLAA